VTVYVLTRHAHSTLNAAGRVNGDPAVEVPITEDGRMEAEQLGHRLVGLELELCVVTRFQRTKETADAILGNRSVPRLVEPLLDDIDIGELEGARIEEYRTWKHEHPRNEPFPGGESLDAAALRYAQAFRKLLERPEHAILVVCHEIPVRYAVNAAAGSTQLDGPEHRIPNATAYLFDPDGLTRAAARIDELAG
jgi:broad specificity phosphatase PhoE